MYTLRVRNVHSALPSAMSMMKQDGTRAQSRNGAVLQTWEPVATVYERPEERVLFHPWRDANPFFHFYESLWMLAGRRDVNPLTRYVKRMASFSDDGKTFNAAYGHRWRKALETRAEFIDSRGMEHEHFIHERDQLLEISELLKKDHTTRQCVLQIWDHQRDLGTQTKDHACNLTATFQIDPDDNLNMVVFCRSNDIIWGCYGANAVHFSMLHEYMARRIGVLVGTYTQISVNWHAYLDIFEPMYEKMITELQHCDKCKEFLCLPERNPHHYIDGRHMYPTNPYDEEVETYPLCGGYLDNTWDEDCRNFVTNDGTLPTATFQNSFFADVAFPIVAAHDLYRAGKIDDALMMIENCHATDWRKACREWLDRRIK